METIYSKARELAELLLDTEAGKNLESARFIFDGNEEAQKILFKYNDYRNDIQMKMQEGKITGDELETAKLKLTELANNVKNHEVAGALVKAENNFNNLVNHVMDVFGSTLAGEFKEETSCSGSCSSCSGCH